MSCTWDFDFSKRDFFSASPGWEKLGNMQINKSWSHIHYIVIVIVSKKERLIKWWPCYFWAVPLQCLYWFAHWWPTPVAQFCPSGLVLLSCTQFVCPILVKLFVRRWLEHTCMPPHVSTNKNKYIIMSHPSSSAHKFIVSSSTGSCMWTPRLFILHTHKCTCSFLTPYILMTKVKFVNSTVSFGWRPKSTMDHVIVYDRRKSHC